MLIINLKTDTVIDGNIIPSSNLVFNLGTSNNRWRDLYLSDSSIYLNNTVISSDSFTGGLIFTNTENNKKADIYTGQIKLQIVDDSI